MFLLLHIHIADQRTIYYDFFCYYYIYLIMLCMLMYFLFSLLLSLIVLLQNGEEAKARD